jgi:hypothetical protein
MKKKLPLVRNSEVQAYKRCRLRWYWGWVLKLQPKLSHPALRFGNLGHLSLEKWYIPGRKRGVHPAKTFKKEYERELETLSAFRLRDDEKWVKAGEMGVDLMTNYVDHYGDEPHIEIIAPEMAFEVTVHHPKTGRPMYVAVGKMDAPYYNHETGRFGILDHKHMASISTNHLGMADQPAMYDAFAPEYFRRKRILKKGQKISHILFNFLRKAMRDSRPQNKKGQYLNMDGSVSKKQPPAFFERYPVWRGEGDREELRRRLTNVVWEMNQVRRGKLPIYKTPSYDCPQCPFFDACELHESGADYEELLRMTTEKWDPYDYVEIAREKG